MRILRDVVIRLVFILLSFLFPPLSLPSLLPQDVVELLSECLFGAALHQAAAAGHAGAASSLLPSKSKSKESRRFLAALQRRAATKDKDKGNGGGGSAAAAVFTRKVMAVAVAAALAVVVGVPLLLLSSHER